jgi:hypothetical protein
MSLFLLEHADDSEKLRPEELNQQTIEALVAESNLVLFKTAYTILLLPLYRIFFKELYRIYFGRLCSHWLPLLV